MKTTQAAPAAPKSQIAAMSGNVPAKQAPSRFVMGIMAYVKGGDAKIEYALALVADAVKAAYKGNQRDLPAALEVCAGKNKASRAFHAGFTAIIAANDGALPKTVPYTGKLDSPANADVRAEIDARTASSMVAFKEAFLTVINEKPTPKAKPVAAPAAEAPAAEAPAAAPVIVADIGTTVTESVQATISAIQAGALADDEMKAIYEAITAAYVQRAVAIAASTETETA